MTKVGTGIKAFSASLNRRVSKPPQRAQSIVKSHNNDIFSADQFIEVVEALVTRCITTTVNPKHDGLGAADGTFLRFYVHVQAIFCSDDTFAGDTTRIVGLLDAGHCIPSVIDGLSRYHRVRLAVGPRGFPSEITNRCLRVGDISVA